MSATVQHQIVRKFLEVLAASGEVEARQIDELRSLLAGNKKPKPDDFVRVFSPAEEEDIQ